MLFDFSGLYPYFGHKNNLPLSWSISHTKVSVSITAIVTVAMTVSIALCKTLHCYYY